MFYTHPPEQHDLPAHLSAEIVQIWGTEFDVVSFCLYSQLTFIVKIYFFDSSLSQNGYSKVSIGAVYVEKAIR